MILFHLEDVKFHVEHKLAIKKWIKAIAVFHDKKVGDVNFILCSDQFLLSMNQKYLQHDFFTDIITFPSEERPNVIGGDVFISLDRVKDNATHYQVDFFQELLRILAHGVLHLCGYEDTTPELKKQMSLLEEQCLAMFHVEL